MSPSTRSTVRTRLPTASLPTPLKAGAFWAAVLLPFLAVGLLVRGLETRAHVLLLVAVLALDVLALLVGHDYGQ